MSASFQEFLALHHNRVFKYLTLPELKRKVSILNQSCRDLTNGYILWKEMMSVVRTAI